MHGYNFIKKQCLLLLLLFVSCSIFAQTADFTFAATDSLSCAPYKITFTQTATGNPIGFIWDFGNGDRRSNPSELVVYTLPGNYIVTLTALYSTTAVSVSKTIHVNATPSISLVADKDYLCSPGSVQFTAPGSNFVNQYQWDFGDSSTEQNTLNTTTHTYSNYGTYTATVKATTAIGCSTIASYSIKVSKFDIAGNVSVTEGCIPVASTLSVTTALPPGDRAINYAWNFGDESGQNTGTNTSVTHTYNGTDSITNANVIITTASGCSNIYTFPAFAFGTPPTNTVVKIPAANDTFCASETIKFTGRAIKANLYKWDFGDNVQTTTSDTIVTHQYRSLGNKTIVVTPFFNGCEGAKDSIKITIEGVVANFYFGNLCNQKSAYQFFSSSLGNISSFKWELSDNPAIQDSANLRFTHNFPVSGSFITTLSLADNTTGCTDTVHYNIYTAVPVFTASSKSICKDSLVTYQVINTYPPTAGYLYDFYINGDSVLNSTDSVLKYYPSTHGSFANYVVVKDAYRNTCNDTLRLDANSIVKGPVVNFTSLPRNCVNKLFPFTNASSVYNPAEPIATWRWQFGDNTEDAAKDPAPHQFAAPGLYTISLTATDINGCAQRMEKDILSDYLPTVISFPAMDTICLGRDTAMLTGYTTDTLMWLPATNISCTSCDTAYVHPVTTTAYIARATNRFGCQSFDTSIVKVYAPFQLKISPADTSICLGKSVSYNLNVNGITTWLPTTSMRNASQNLTVTPTADIIYSAIVTDSAGCYSDSASANVHVLPLPTVNAGPDRVVPYNSTFNITPVYGEGVSSYLWETTARLDCNNCPSIAGTALKTTIYTIKTTSAQGCKSSDNITISIACENSNLLMPTAFSPNGNGINEYFYPIARGYRTIRKFSIFNRNGFKVFERQNFAANDRSLGWDGRIKSSEPAGSTETFAWFIEAECEQGEVISTKGTVVLIR